MIARFTAATTRLPEQDYDKFKRYNAAAPPIFVMPDYRLSLREPFPAGLNDCYDTLIWVRDNAGVIEAGDGQGFTSETFDPVAIV